jgi:hypothetical protein
VIPTSKKRSRLLIHCILFYISDENLGILYFQILSRSLTINKKKTALCVLGKFILTVYKNAATQKQLGPARLPPAHHAQLSCIEGKTFSLSQKQKRAGKCESVLQLAQESIDSCYRKQNFNFPVKTAVILKLAVQSS